MITPILTTAQSHLSGYFAQLKPGERKPFTVPYSFQGYDFTSALGFWLGIDESRAFICPTCGCCVRVLTHYEDRPGLCCPACVSKREHRADTLPKKRATMKAAPKGKPAPRARRKARKVA